MIIEIPGAPIPKQRHRTFVRGGHVASYDPQDTDKQDVRYKMIFRRGSNDIIKNSPLHVRMTFFMPIAKSSSNLVRNWLSWFPQQSVKPDVDNLAKFYLDCANGVLWNDDSQVVSLQISKRYDSAPRTVIVISQDNSMDIDHKAKGILSMFPKDMFDEFINDLLELGKASHYDSDLCAENGVNAQKIALLISKMADKYASELIKVKKKYPKYWEREELISADEADYRGCVR